MSKFNRHRITISFDAMITDEFKLPLGAYLVTQSTAINSTLNQLDPEGFGSMVAPTISIIKK